MTGPTILGLLVIAWPIGYYVSLRIWPLTSCRRCAGTGKNAGSNRKRFGRCGKCKGTGRKLRLGTRVLNTFHE